MPQIDLLKPNNLKKLDLTSWFKEYAFITIRRIGKYKFSYLSNKSKEGYIYTLYREAVNTGKDVNNITDSEYLELGAEFSPENTLQMMLIDQEVRHEYAKEGICPDQHNFFDKGIEVALDGDWFMDTYGELQSEGITLSNFVNTEIIRLSQSGLVLGE